MVLLAALALALASPPTTSLSVTYHPQGIAGPPKAAWRIDCAPARGTHPAPGRACLELRRPRAETELAPASAPCTLMIAPRTPFTQVKGILRGKPVNRVLRPGCDDAAWRDLHVLLTGR